MRTSYQPTLFSVPAIAKVSKPEPVAKKVSEAEKKKNKRKYNASYRLRQKVGEAAFPKKSRNVFCELGNDEVENLTEIKILTEEYGFAVKPLAFPNL